MRSDTSAWMSWARISISSRLWFDISKVTRVEVVEAVLVLEVCCCNVPVEVPEEAEARPELLETLDDKVGPRKKSTKYVRHDQ